MSTEIGFWADTIIERTRALDQIRRRDRIVPPQIGRTEETPIGEDESVLIKETDQAKERTRGEETDLSREMDPPIVPAIKVSFKRSAGFSKNFSVLRNRRKGVHEESRMESMATTNKSNTPFGLWIVG